MAQAGYTPIQLYFSTTAAAVPLAANLAQGELAINIVDGKLYYENSSGVVTLLASAAGASGDVVGPASATDNAVARFDGTTGKLIQNGVVIIGDTGAVTGVTDLTASGTVTLSGGTANGVAYLNGSKVVTSGSALTFDGTTLANTGNITAGTTSSGANLNAYASTYNSNGMVRLFGTDGNNKVEFGAASATTAFLTARSGVSMIFGANDAEGMRLTSTGLGIGTSSPAQKLDVRAAAGGIYLSSTTGTNQVALQTNNSGGDFYFGIDNSAGNNFNTGTAYAGVLWRSGANPICFVNNNTERMRLDSSGNLGLGVTPSAWFSSAKVLQIGATASLSDLSGAYTLLGQNYKTGTAGQDVYLTTGAASLYSQNAGGHRWYSAPSGTAGANMTLTQAMTLDASGNLLVGGTSAGYSSSGRGVIEINGSSSSLLAFRIGNTNKSYIFQDGTNFNFASSITGGALIFQTQDTERARIDSSGNVQIGTTTSAGRLTVATSTAVDATLTVKAEAANYASIINIEAQNDNGAIYNYIASNTTSVTQHWKISGGAATNTMAFSTGGTERARITSGGNFIIGATTSGAGARLEVNGVSSAGEVASFTGTSALGTLQIFNQPGVTNRRWGIPAGQDAFIWTGFNSGAYLEQMRLDNTGNLLVGTTSVISAGKYSSSFNGSVSNGIILQTTLASSGSTFIGFINSAGSTIGSINQNATSTVIYNTSSDYRLKNITGALTGYKERLMSLQPKQGTWIADGSEFRGFLAHEFAEPYRASVTGEKDAVDEAGNPIYQGMQASSSEVMADLVAMVNELITENASLKARLDAANL